MVQLRAGDGVAYVSPTILHWGSSYTPTMRREPHHHCWDLGCILPKSASNDRADRGLERENLILGYSTQRERRTGGVMQPERVERLQQLGRLSEDMERLLGL